MKQNYKENGTDILSILGTEHFYEPIRLGSYRIEDWDKDPDYERFKLIKEHKNFTNKKGSFVYVYILDGKEVVYIGQTVTTSRIFTPSSIGGFHKLNGEVQIPSNKHGKRNVGTFFQVYNYLKQGHTLDVYLIEAKPNRTIHTETGIKFDVIIAPQQMEKVLQDQYKTFHGELPPMHNLPLEAYDY